MTPTEGRKTKVGTRVKWESSDERGTVVEKNHVGLRVKWDDDTQIIYLFDVVDHGLPHVATVKG